MLMKLGKYVAVQKFRFEDVNHGNIFSIKGENLENKAASIIEPFIKEGETLLPVGISSPIFEGNPTKFQAALVVSSNDEKEIYCYAFRIMPGKLWTIFGEYYGFPHCCIEHFNNRDFTTTLGYSHALIKMGTGYVPCPECAKKSAEELVEAIAKKRKCPTPFPASDLVPELDVIYFAKDYEVTNG